MDLKIEKASSIVRDKNNRILFAGNSDDETFQWAIDKINQDQKKWYKRFWNWFLVAIGIRKYMYHVGFGNGAFEYISSKNMINNTEFAGLHNSK